WLRERFEGLENDPQTHALVASAVAAEQVLDLVERGVGDFHFYTMNRADLVFAICHMIGIRADPAKSSLGSAAACRRLSRTSKRPDVTSGPFDCFHWATRFFLGKNPHDEGGNECKRGTDHQSVKRPCKSHA